MFKIPSRYMMMLFLIGGAASLIGIISSAVYHQPEVTTAQPQPQQPLQPQQSPQQGQLQSPNTAPPTLGKRPAAPQGLQQQKADVGTLVQIQQDKELVNRLFPYIIQKIDGKTLAQKIDAATLLQKIDGKMLAQKVFPYLDLNVAAIERPGQVSNVDITGFRTKTTLVKASCAPEESLVGGAMALHNVAELHSFQRSERPQEPNSWAIITSFDGDGSIRSFAECLKVELALKDVQQQSQQPPPSPSQPPGGPPLRPPPEFGK
jgi:hypothetical protein